MIVRKCDAKTDDVIQVRETHTQIRSRDLIFPHDIGHRVKNYILMIFEQTA